MPKKVELQAWAVFTPENFQTPLRDVARRLGVCTTVLKSECRRYGLAHWPYRRLKSIERSLCALRETMKTMVTHTREGVEVQVRDLRAEYDYLINWRPAPDHRVPPSLSFSPSTPPRHKLPSSYQGIDKVEKRSSGPVHAPVTPPQTFADMSQPPPLAYVAGRAPIRCGRHICALLDGASDFALVRDFVREGLRAHCKVLYATDLSETHTRSSVRRMLEYAEEPFQGLDLEGPLQSGALTILATTELYLEDNYFSATRTVNKWRQALKGALEEGYAGLYATGEVPSFGIPPDELVAYEALVEELWMTEPFRTKVHALCQYDRNRFNPSLQVSLMSVHPYIGFKSEVMMNEAPPSHMEFPTCSQSVNGANLFCDRWLYGLLRRKHTDNDMKRRDV